jgi:hypothetical protein
MKLLKKISNWLPWIALTSLTLGLLGYFLFVAQIQLAGDIVEYYGITESVINHHSFELTEQDQKNLEQVLHPSYFKDPGYYIKGKNDQRYPVHFTAYSLLIVPFRLILRAFHQNELKALWITNVAIFASAAFVTMKWFIKGSSKRLIFLSLFFLSPMMSFFIWPGPDMLYVSLLTIGVFALFKRKFGLATILAAIASWHSQPLVIMAVGFGFIHILHLTTVHKFRDRRSITIHPHFLISGIIAGSLVLLPYLYNYLSFGVLTPWTILQDGWTKLHGFGLQNASFQKLFEQFFDLNMGLVWYFPVGFIVAVGGVLWGIIKKNWLVVGVALLTVMTAFFYQTNPAWHYGTAGYGPTRHIIFVVPIIIYLVTSLLSWKRLQRALFLLIVASQVYALSFNNYLEPDLANVLQNTPLAKYVLDHAPAFYEPTPEIFVDRTNHTDLTYPTTAIYKVNGICKKAYVLKTDVQKLLDECKSIPDSYKSALENEFLNIANYPRTLTTVEATFWPNPEACDKNFQPSTDKPFPCMRTVQEVMKATGIKDEDRITTVPNFAYPGIWKMTFGDPIEITVPAGYIVNHYSIDGVYVTY